MPVYAEKNKVNGLTRWYVRTYIEDEFGISKQITKHNKLWLGREGKIKAQQEEIRIRNEFDVNQSKKRKIKIYELKEQYLNFIKGKVDDDTYHNKEVMLSHFCCIDETNQVHTSPNSLVTAWNVILFTNWQKEMKKKKYLKSKDNWVNYSIEHLNRIYGEICNMIDYAITEGYCTINFARQAGKIGTPKEIKLSEQRRDYNVINLNEFLRLMNASKDNLRYNTYFELSFKRGPRPGEARAFRVKDFNYSKQQLMVNHTLSKYDELKDPKTPSSKAVIDLDYELAEKINDLINELRKKEGFNENWFIFGGEKPISSNSLNKAKEKYFKLANIEQYLRLHDFRHSCATWLFSIGIPIQVISKILRHKDIDETLKTYTHLLKEDYEKGINKINLYFEEIFKQDQKQDQNALWQTKTLDLQGITS
ncbi:MAG: site-specific integrase [Firmicutes bacterium]|nr:site-specific integrase [Bacillota bacterium]